MEFIEKYAIINLISCFYTYSQESLCNNVYKFLDLNFLKNHVHKFSGLKKIHTFYPQVFKNDNILKLKKISIVLNKLYSYPLSLLLLLKKYFKKELIVL